MNGVSGCVLNDFSSINACGHNIEINDSVYSDNCLPNKVKNGVVNGAAIGHAISLYKKGGNRPLIYFIILHP